MNKAQLKAQLKGDKQQRVRIVPPARRTDSSAILQTCDDEWIIWEVTDKHIDIQHINTSLTPRLGLDQVHSYTSDPQRNTYNYNYGILKLHVQLTLLEREVRIDLLEWRNPEVRRTLAL
jgi:hypothetical protein